MKHTRVVGTICALVALVFGLAVNAEAALNTCEDSRRNIGPFGAMDQPKSPVPIASEIRSQLPEARSVRRMQETRLAPSGEQIVMYDTGDDSEPKPTVAIVANGTVSKRFDISGLIEYGVGAVYATSCEFELAPNQSGFAIAYTVSGDGTGSAFVVLTWIAGEYKVVLHESVGQGRLVLGQGTLELWERTFGKYATRPDSMKFECEWCDHRYLISQLGWRNGEYVKTSSKRTRKAYDPADITGFPLLIRTDEQSSF